MQIVDKNIEELIPYSKNPRKNDGAVEAVANSIKEFGFKVPIVIDSEDNVVCGHTRLKAAKKLGMKTVPCIIADDLSEEQIKAFRLADNKVGELAEWDFDLLEEELDGIFDIDMSDFGFDISINDGDNFFSNRERDDKRKQEGNDEYNEFLEKFEPKKTTDDCYTPDNVYNAVCEWAENEYKVKKENFVRPFYPGGDYQKYKYASNSIVVDNPPFSILAEILNYYTENNIKYFLFAPALTLFSSSSSSSCAIATGVTVTYENGACVNTSFVTNLEDKRFRSAPDLYKIIKAANDINLREQKRELPKYEYPDYVITAAKLAYFSKYGVVFAASREETFHIRRLDSQKESDKDIFGSGYLISDKKATEKAAAEKAAAEKAAAERWRLSERENEIIKQLSE